MPGVLAKTFLLATLSIASAMAQAQTVPTPSRGQLLYNTHCISCHSTQMHWRDERRARDWDGLKFQVRRWQDVAGLQWTEADIVEVARHLNSTIYRFPLTANQLSRLDLR